MAVEEEMMIKVTKETKMVSNSTNMSMLKFTTFDHKFHNTVLLA